MSKPHLPETTLGPPDASNLVTAPKSTHASDLQQWGVSAEFLQLDSLVPRHLQLIKQYSTV